MSRQPVAELWVQRRAGALVRVGSPPSTALAGVPNPPGRGDLRAWVDRSAISPAALMFGGLGLATTGVVIATLFGPSSLAAVAAVSSMITLGSGLTFLGVLKKKGSGVSPEAPASPVSTTSPTVLAERARRAQAALAQNGQSTFEALLAHLKWTEGALLETLVVMKDQGIVEEDLDLDTGEWVYRVQVSNVTGAASSMMLEDRQARSSAEQT